MYSGILLGHKKIEILPFVTMWMDFESIMLSKISQRKQILYDSTFTWTRKTNEQIADNKKETVINRYREQTGGC